MMHVSLLLLSFFYHQQAESTRRERRKQEIVVLVVLLFFLLLPSFSASIIRLQVSYPARMLSTTALTPSSAGVGL
jgi:hypothetical protein